MDIETLLEEELVKAIKPLSSKLAHAPDLEARSKLEDQISELISKLETLLKGESTATAKEQEEALEAIKTITVIANEKAQNIGRVTEMLNKTADTISKVEKVASKVIPYV